MRYFSLADHVKVEAFDHDTSIITVMCPKDLARDILLLTDALAQASRFISVRGRVAHASLMAKEKRELLKAGSQIGS